VPFLSCGFLSFRAANNQGRYAESTGCRSHARGDRVGFLFFRVVVVARLGAEIAGVGGRRTDEAFVAPKIVHTSFFLVVGDA